MLYRERLLPGVTITLLSFGLFLMVGVAYSAAFGSFVGIALALIISAIYIFFAITTAPQIRIHEEAGVMFLSAGHATIDISIIGSTRQLSDTQRIEVKRGGRSDTAFSLVKGNFPVVELEISDPSDPHGNWCLSSRTPDTLIQAIDSARGPKIL